MVLSHLPVELAVSAGEQLKKLGVEIRVSTKVRNMQERWVELDNGDTIAAENIVWAAGVSASPMARKLGVELDRAGRVKVRGDLSIPGHPEVFVVGDMATVVAKDGRLVPGICPAAMQMGRYVARIIEDELAAPAPDHAPRAPFAYWDKGTMATIGRSAAVAQIGRFEFTGLVAWGAWLFIHLIFLVGFRNKLAVLLQWAYSYISYKRGARIVTGVTEEWKRSPPA